jgi:hypothetical protein
MFEFRVEWGLDAGIVACWTAVNRWISRRAHRMHAAANADRAYRRYFLVIQKVRGGFYRIYMLRGGQSGRNERPMQAITAANLQFYRLVLSRT